MKFIFKAAILAIPAIMITACAQSLPPHPMPHFAFDQKAPISVSVGQVLFQNQPAQSSGDEAFPMTLSQSVGHWVNKRLAASGDAGGTLTVSVAETSVTKTPLPVTKGFKGIFTVDQEEKYTAKLGVAIQADGGATANQTGQINVARSITVPENATLAERERTWVKLTEDLMADFDASAERFFTNEMQAGAVVPAYR